MGRSFGRPFRGKERVERAEAHERDLAGTQEQIAREMFGQTAGLRGGSVDTLQRVLAGERPENFRIFAPEREAVESQFRTARENIIASSPARGGQLNELLAGTDRARAQTLGGMEADIRRQAFLQALSVGFGAAPAIGLGAFQNAGQLFSTIANRNETGVMGKNSAFGSIGGQLSGMGAAAGGGCWIAAALYGYDTPEFYLARCWIFTLWRGPVAAVVRWLYRRYGERAARCPWLVARLRPLFDRAVARARAQLAA